MTTNKWLTVVLLLGAVAYGTWVNGVLAQQPGEPPEFPPFAEVSKGHDPVPFAGEPSQPMYSLWIRKRDGHLLAELPKDFPNRKYFIGATVASGETYAGLQGPVLFAYWRQFDKRIALVESQVTVRSNGDPESRSSVARIFTDRFIADTQILTYGPHGGPVIDIGSLLIQNSGKLFGGHAQGAIMHLVTTKTAKVFPRNVELAFEMPIGDGHFKTLHYSLSELPDASGYRPRQADERVGYFTTAFNDLGRFHEDGTWIRYIRRWRVEKRDPSLKLSPPKNPIVFYIEHSTPVRYRPWVKKGILAWNSAFEKIGVRDCIDVRQQDSVTGEHMDKDPEDVRYNFVRWLNNDVSTAIGPSRFHPLTGEILDADIILTDGWIRNYLRHQTDILPQVAAEGWGKETKAWVAEHPEFDPRRLFGVGASADAAQHQDDLLRNAQCAFSTGLALDVDSMRMSLETMSIDLGPNAEPSGNVLDGMPEEFVGPLVAMLTAHEVGHTLGLRHNFRGSGAVPLVEMNRPENEAKPLSTSVMDYLPVNINLRDGKLRSNFTLNGIGAYDTWAIQYGYSFEEDLKPILARSNEPELAYSTDEDADGPDPLAKRYDLGANPVDFAKVQLGLAQQQRKDLIEKFVRDGQSWAKARRGYETTLGTQMRALSIMADWLGGAHVRRQLKGDSGAKQPIEVISPQAQRDALNFVIENSFRDEAFGLTPQLLSHLGLDQWYDEGGEASLSQESAWPVHDKVAAIQSIVLTSLLGPSTVKLVFDNELRTPPEADAVTLPEILDTIGRAIWSELDSSPPAGATARKPWISSLRRDLQREHIERLIALSMPESSSPAVRKPVANLALSRLSALLGQINKTLEQRGAIDPYTLAHLDEAARRISKAIDAQYIYNIKDAARSPRF